MNILIKILLIILEKVIVELAKMGILKLLSQIQWKENLYVLKRLLLKQFDLENIKAKANKVLQSEELYALSKKVMLITLQSTYVISGAIFLIAHTLSNNIFFSIMIASSVVIPVEIPYRMLIKEAKA
ncbi:MAG: hypothetical protein ACN6PN_00025 [Sphingobacterium sp.]